MNKSFVELEERTLVVKNFDPKQTTKELLEELFANFGPVNNIVLKSDHAFIEYSKKDSVGYAFAMIDGIRLHGRTLISHPKLKDKPSYYKYIDALKQFENECRRNKNFLEQFLNKEQQENKNKMLKDYERSKQKQRQIQERLRRYRYHYESQHPDSKFNPYFGQCLNDDDRLKYYQGHDYINHRSSKPYDQRYDDHQSLQIRHHHHHNQHNNQHGNRMIPIAPQSPYNHYLPNRNRYANETMPPAFERFPNYYHDDRDIRRNQRETPPSPHRSHPSGSYHGNRKNCPIDIRRHRYQQWH